MIINVNFGNEDSALPSEEFILDSGAGFSEAQGFGWITEESLNDAVGTPIDLSTNTREREASDDQSIDTFIHLQYPTGLSGARADASITTPGAWEYVLENGSYQITVGVGDSAFTDSNHVINVEGQTLISSFVPSEEQLFTEATTTVEVTDGRLTIDAIGGENTKLNFLEIVAEDSTDTDTDTENAIEPIDDSATPEDSSETDTTDDGNTPEDSSDTDTENAIEPIDDSATPEDSSETDTTDGDDTSEDGFDTGGADNSGIPGTILDEPLKINFGTPVVSSAGDIQDIGKEFTDEQGFGWITQDSVGSGNPVPIDIRGNTRDRNSIAQEDLDSLIHLQFSEDFTQPNSVTTPAAWEFVLANGEYAVTVAVGDPDFTDSNHVINIEGNNVISGFTPTENQLFETTTSIVEVTDGRLTIDAIGGENTKLNFVEIAPVDPLEVNPIEIPTDVGIPVEGGGVVEIVQPVANGINVNFGVPSFGSPSGFIVDIGQAYSESQGFGWVTQDSAGTSEPVPISVIPNGRDRNTLFNDGQGSLFNEPVLDSLIHLQYPTGLPNSDTSVTTPAAWEYALANGQYEVTVGVGDSDFFDSNHVINVEGENLISGFTPTGEEVNGFLPLGAQAFTTGSAIVEVEDGRLTVDAIGGENTKINFISIVAVDAL